jgi:putative ABC transport system permease protein
MALVLASIGVMGVVGFVASQRSKECGIRLALGAAPRAVRWMIARQGVWPVMVGIAAGVAGTRAAERVMARYLVGVGGVDGLALCLDVALLATVSGLAALLPARRATQVDPASALRCD